MQNQDYLRKDEKKNFRPNPYLELRKEPRKRRYHLSLRNPVASTEWRTLARTSKSGAFSTKLCTRSYYSVGSNEIHS